MQGRARDMRGVMDHMARRMVLRPFHKPPKPAMMEAETHKIEQEWARRWRMIS